ncbi:hypothetical protein H9Y05_12515 [Crocinitomicaceae bacterium CZZ-1]|uniref:Uncharacterized protein n=1 Tax=Taishania pollutisoli TaxID=2766479 RepID=A0A8J6PRI5_9FLAO|nr:hypothetical protein [Taishania pollutisoli]MBC9813293.1 hypothetical protein [Taishania pollutisoli]
MRKNIKKVASITLMCVITVSASFAQNDADLFRFSKHYHGGSARFEAMGGAFGALGADISSVQVNPAGLGRFSSSQFSLSLSPTINSTNASFMGTDTKTVKTSFSVPSFGVVLTKDLSSRNKGDMYSQFAFGMNRVAHYNQRTVIEGVQFPSLLDNFIGQANGYYPEELSQFFPFSTSLAYESYTIDYDSISNSYTSYLNAGDMKMKREIATRGGINEFFLSYSRNRMNRLYYGFALNIRTYNYTESYVHSEDLTVTDPDFNGFDYEYTLRTKGTGVNLKLGAIYLITDGFRIGASFHTPTYIGMEDKWTATMTGRFKEGNYSVPEQLVPEAQYKYRMITPLRAVVSASYVIGMNAVISGDVEYTGYNMGRLRSTTDVTYEPYDFDIENADAKARLTNALNYRLGAEFNIQQKFFLRAGFALYGNAYKKSENIDPKPDISYSGGLGYKIGRFSIDVAYVNRNMQRTYYSFLGSNVANTRLSNNSVIISASIRF